MNKIIPTTSRIFMAVVGPSGCGKTDLIFKMLLNHTFYPTFKRILFFYKEWQDVYHIMSNKLPIDFIEFSDFEITKTLEDVLLIYDDSCEEIYNDKEFVKIATSGRHRRIHVIYVKHNLFQQSKNSRTIDLNTTHIVLFKSLRDIQQLDHLGKQLNKLMFLRDCFSKATQEPHGHLLLDLDPNTTDGLRFCSNITEPGITIFYLPQSKAFPTTISNEKERAIYAEANASHVTKKSKAVLAYSR